MSRPNAGLEAGDGAAAARGVKRRVRLDLSPEDHDRLARAAKRLGLSKAACARMAVLARLAAEADKEANLVQSTGCPVQ